MNRASARRIVWGCRDEFMAFEYLLRLPKYSFRSHLENTVAGNRARDLPRAQTACGTEPPCRVLPFPPRRVATNLARALNHVSYI